MKNFIEVKGYLINVNFITCVTYVNQQCSYIEYLAYDYENPKQSYRVERVEVGISLKEIKHMINVAQNELND